ncbi:MAG TPA: ATP-binding protein [Methylomusa anaerophila]|nr:ATP-binding protein [Methylomusa anaerophila]HML87550.1 ATP-binding protein [Methylomusa anaerophila]
MMLVYFEKTRADLISKEEALRQTNRELNNFCHSVAHDLKGPLLSINQLAEELAGADNFKQDQYPLIQYIKGKSAELVNITEYLLELSRMSQKQLKIETIQLEPLFCDIYADLLALQPGRQVDFKIRKLPKICGDRIMIKLLVRNILSNALKFTRKRELAIIEVDTEEVENNYVISIKDNGAGFDMSESSRLFGIFERLHPSRDFEGHGVGLTICQKILQRHNGKAWLTGKVDEGAVFSFSFPKDMSKQRVWPVLVAPDTIN